MTEIGSGYCHGVAGQTDTFATALWAPDQLFTQLAAGVAGANVEVRPNQPNSALIRTTSSLYAEPMFYGLALFARALGPDAQLMRVSEQGKLRQLKIWAVQLGDGTLHVLYINKASRAAKVTLSVPATARRPARLERLTAPSIYANQSVTLAGQRLGPDGRWHRRRAVIAVTPRNLSYRVRVPALSAALLAVPAPR
jgi:hypothetical protein